MLRRYKKQLLLSLVFFLSFGSLVIMYFSPFSLVRPFHPVSKTTVLGTATKHTTPTPLPSQAITPTASPASQIAFSHHPIALGVWTQGFWDTSSNTLHPETISSLEQRLGKRFAIAHYYRGWEALVDSGFVSQLQLISSHGWRPMISINPYFFDKCNVTGVALYKAIAQGNCDEFLKAAAQNVKQVSFPFFLRFAWEMNATSMAWGIQKTGSSNEDFIGAWRHMHDVFTAEGVTQAIWVFSPNAEQVADPTFNEYYPGDSYVDWVGLDGYNWGKTQTWSSWQSFETVFSSSYRKLTRIATSKPVMLAEVNTTDVGGNKAVWLQDMFATVTSSRFSQVQAIVFYNEDRSASEQVNWRLDESPIYMQTVAQALKNQVFTSSL